MKPLSIQSVGLVLGPVLFLLTEWFFRPAELDPEGRAVLAITLWMAAWWVTEAVPIAATALLPMVLFPLTGALSASETLTYYSGRLVILLMGGFMLANAITRWNLHRRIALSIIALIGGKLPTIVLGFMLACAALSMWISNTATSVMMMPIGLAVIRQLSGSFKTAGIDEEQFGRALMLAIAYACSIGGMATLVGTPTNLIFTGVVRELYGVEISFTQWFIFGLPISLILLFLVWRYLTRYAFHLPSTGLGAAGSQEIQRQLRELGPIRTPELRTLIIFGAVAVAWIFRATVLETWIPAIDDTIIAVIGVLLMFILPAGDGKGARILDWKTAEAIPWGILLLLGGGFAIAGGFGATGLAVFLGEQLAALQFLPVFVLLLVIIAAVNFLTELTSNVATASMLMPILAALAFSIDFHPYGLMVGATLAATCAFMLPIATPPNMVVFGSGYLTIPVMIRVGFLLNLLSIVIVALMVYFVLPYLWGIELNDFPADFGVSAPPTGVPLPEH